MRSPPSSSATEFCLTRRSVIGSKLSCVSADTGFVDVDQILLDAAGELMSTRSSPRTTSSLRGAEPPPDTAGRPAPTTVPRRKIPAMAGAMSASHISEGSGTGPPPGTPKGSDTRRWRMIRLVTVRSTPC
jgi:hypothetical protein